MNLLSGLRRLVSRLTRHEQALVAASPRFEAAVAALAAEDHSNARQQLQEQLLRLEKEQPLEINLRLYVMNRLGVVLRILGEGTQFSENQVNIFLENLSLRGPLDPDNLKFAQNAFLACLSNGEMVRGQTLARFIIEDAPGLSSKVRALAGYYLVLFQSGVQMDFIEEVQEKVKVLQDSWRLKFNLAVVKWQRHGQGKFDESCQDCALSAVSQLQGCETSQLYFLKEKGAAKPALSSVRLKNELSTVGIKQLANMYMAADRLKHAYYLHSLVLNCSSQTTIAANLTSNVCLALINSASGDPRAAELKLLTTLRLANNGSAAQHFAMQVYVDLLRTQERFFQAEQYQRQLQGKQPRESLGDRLLLPDFDFLF